MDLTKSNLVDRLASQLYALTEVSKTLSLPLDLPELLNLALEKISQVLAPAEVGLVMLFDASSGLFRAVASCGFDLDMLKQIALRQGESITGKVFENGAACLLSEPQQVALAMADMREANLTSFKDSLYKDGLPLCALASPISVGSQKYGVLLLETIEGPETFSESDIPFVQTLADLIGLAIDRVRLQAKADAANQVNEAEKTRLELMATLSHELRMPLTSIKGYATALMLSDIHWNQQQQGEFLQRIEDESINMEMMIRDILDSSLISIDHLNIEPEPVRLDHILRDVVSETQRRVSDHQLLEEFPPDFPILLADTRWIKQVFRNILDNALKYSPDGGLIVIQGNVRPNDVVISIADQGIGISPEDQIPLFEKFYRVKNGNYRFPGTGLGLPAARAIIEAHGGKIWVESKLGQGTTVFLSLPKNKDLLTEQ
ncbi:MAG TPA: ATP-binding protein [Anaerolineaceae bacterium]